ncbi:MAG: hypothetical protein EOQ44_25375 [Mesorhizobium sp.]|uniref:hypothetical protein n=1 Tax=Mesorhizobium sp. TaxID=1871066 RepID=UPI000FEA1F53|nr:hypothetical protein [Mesorhizobium sp.]RWB40472.1 MAG: hypothetical protein EOQ44_25375 [Mesorhizobium sp.]
MAPLTWQQVAAPNFSGVADSQRLAAQLLASSFGGLQSSLSDFQKSRQDAASSTYLAGISRFTDPTSLDAALKSGAVDATNVSPDAIKFAMGRQQDLLANQQQGLVNDRTQYSNDAYKRDDQLAQSRLAAQPEAAKLLASVQQLAGSGNPADVEKARQMIADGSQTLLNAGYKADAFPGLLDAARTTGTAGFGYKKDVLANDQFWENQGITLGARKLAFDAINGNATPDVAIRQIQNDDSIKDPRVKAQAIEVINQSADQKVFATADQGTQLLNALGIQTAVPQSVPQGRAAPAPGNGGGGIQNPLSQLVDAKEGGGDYSTLYAHAQKDGGAFAGVDVSKQTIGQLKQFASGDGAYGQHQKAKLGYLATPMGRYQIVGDTLSDTAKEMGLPDNTVFTPEVQDAMFQHIADKALSGPRSMAGKMAALRGKWDGFRNVPDSTLSAAISAYENGDRGQLGNITNGQSTPTGNLPSAPQVVAQTSAAPSGPNIVQPPKITMPVGTTLDQYQAPSPLDAFQSQAPDRGLPTGGQEATPAQQLALAAAAGANKPKLPAAQPDANALAPQVPVGDGQEASYPATPAQQLAAAVTPTGSNQAPTGQGQTDSPAMAAQKLLDQQTVDQAFNADAPLISQLQQAQNSKDTVQQVIDKLTADGGPLAGMNKQAALASLNETIQLSGGKLKPAAAGALIAQHPESRDLQARIDKVPILGSLIPDSWFSGDRFGGPENGGTSATRINMDGVKNDLNKIGVNVDGSIKLARGTAQIQNQRLGDVSQQQITAIHAQLLSSQAEAVNIAQAIQRGQDTPENRAALARALSVVDQLNQVLQQIGQEPGSPTTIFTGQGENKRPQ